MPDGAWDEDSNSLPPYCAVLVVDTEGFGSNSDGAQELLGKKIPEVLAAAFERARLSHVWQARLFQQDTGDGMGIGFDPTHLPAVVTRFFDALQDVLAEVDIQLRAHSRRVRLRMRASLHVGPVRESDPRSGSATARGSTVITAHRLVDTPAVREALKRSDPEQTFLSVAVSQQVYEAAVVGGYTTLPSSKFVPTNVRIKEYAGTVYHYVPNLSGDLLRYGSAIHQQHKPDDTKYVQAQASVTTNIMAGTAHNVLQAGNVGNVNVYLPEADRRDNVGLLREVTKSNLRALADYAALPSVSGAATVQRSEFQALLDVEGDFVLTGEPGCGKSGALYHLARRLVEQGEDVVLLSVDSLGSQPGAVRDDVVLDQALNTVLREWSGDGRATLLIDGLDAARGGSLTWLANLVADLAGSRWRAVATMRRFDLRYSSLGARAFAGPPVSQNNDHRDGDLPNVRHFVLGNFSTDELAQLAADHPDIGRLITGTSEHLVDLIRNPFNLRLACELLQSGVSVGALASARDQLALLKKYWDARVMRQPDREARIRVLERLSRTMLDTRTLQASGSSVPDALLDARTALVRDGALKELPTRLLASGSPPLAYSHHILFDYGVAALILTAGDESQLVTTLDQDPDLVLVVRPSIDLHLADLWHADDSRTRFAQVVTALAQQQSGLGGVAAMRVLTSEVTTEDDLAWITDPAAGHGAALVTVSGWIAGIMDAADELLKGRIRDRLETWTTLLAAVTTQVEHEFQAPLANQTYRLLWQLNSVQKMCPGMKAATIWADCVATLIRIALAEPAEREWLATGIARFLPQAVAINPEHTTVLRRTLEPDIMVLWQPRYLDYYVDAIDTIAVGDAEAARDVLLTVLCFDEDREEATPLSEGVLSISSSRRKDVDMAKYHIGSRMRAFITAAGLDLAAGVLAQAVQLRDAELSDDMPGYPIVVRSARGQIDAFGPGLKFGPGHGVAEAIVAAFTEALQDVDPDAVDLDMLVEDLVARVRHPEAWRHLLAGAARRPVVLGYAFLPTLLSGGMLVHDDTRAAAGLLIQAVSPILPDADHQSLEQAILDAPRLFHTPSEERANRLIDQLGGCLAPQKIHDAALAARIKRLSESGRTPAIPEPDDGQMTMEPTTLREYLGLAQDDMLTDTQREALDALRHTLAALPNDITPEQVAAVVQTLHRALETGVTRPDHIGPGSELVLRAIETIVRTSPPAPDSELAALVIPLVLGAARAGDAPQEGTAS